MSGISNQLIVRYGVPTNKKSDEAREQNVLQKEFLNMQGDYDFKINNNVFEIVE